MAKRAITVEVELPDNIDTAILDGIESWISNEAWIMTRPYVDGHHDRHDEVWNEYRAATGQNLQVSPTVLKIRVADSNGRCGGP